MKIITVRPDGSRRVQTLNEEPSRTRQEFKDDCDVNIILNKYMKTGSINHFAKHKGQYADLTNAQDYQTSLNTILKARQMFDDMPSELRNKFDNDPKKLLEFVHDDKNYDEAAKLGLVPEKPVIPTTPPSSNSQSDKGGT